MALGQAAPLLENFATARGAAYAIFSVIDDVSSLVFISSALSKEILFPFWSNNIMLYLKFARMNINAQRY